MLSKWLVLLWVGFVWLSTISVAGWDNVRHSGRTATWRSVAEDTWVSSEYYSESVGRRSELMERVLAGYHLLHCTFVVGTSDFTVRLSEVEANICMLHTRCWLDFRNYPWPGVRAARFVRFSRWSSSEKSALSVKFSNLFVNNISAVIAELVGRVAAGCSAGIQVP